MSFSFKQRSAAMKAQAKLLETLVGQVRSFKNRLPEVAEAYERLPAETYKDGAISGKNKRLMALSASLIHGCRGCVLFQTDEAVKQGASVEEILESCAVAISLGGTMATSETARVMAFLEEKGVL